MLGDHGFDGGSQFGVQADPLLDDRVLGRELEAGDAKDGVHTSGKDGDFQAFQLVRGVLHLEGDLGALTAADPVTLHGAHLLGPAGQFVEAIEEFIAVLGDAQKPLHHLTLLDEGVFVPPAATADHLLVGQHGGASGAPIQLAGLAVGKAALIHFEEEPLVPAVVLGLAAGKFRASPVVAEAETAHLNPHLVDVAQGPLARRHVVLKRRILGRQAKGVPTHGMEHVVAAHPHIAGQGIADGVIADMADMELPARIRQHLEAVKLRPGFALRGERIVGTVQGRIGVPARLPARFELGGVIAQGLLGGLLRGRGHGLSGFGHAAFILMKGFLRGGRRGLRH